MNNPEEFKPLPISEEMLSCYERAMINIMLKLRSQQKETDICMGTTSEREIGKCLLQPDLYL